jgi:hypothetical protein
MTPTSYLISNNALSLTQVSGSRLLNSPKYFGIFLFFLAFVHQQFYRLRFTQTCRSVFAAHLFYNRTLKMIAKPTNINTITATNTFLCWAKTASFKRFAPVIYAQNPGWKRNEYYKTFYANQ